MSSNQTLDQNQTDIDQILNEVEELRKELNTEAQTVDTQAVAKEIADHLTEAPVAATPVSVPTPVAVAPSAPSPAEPAPTTPTVAQATQVARELAAIEEIAKAADISTTDDLMKEFNASLEQEPTEATTDMFGTADSGESMESTLAELKEDTSVKTLLDETFDDQARRQNETHTGSHTDSMLKEQSPMNNSNNSSNSGNSGSGNSSNEAAPSLTMSLTGSMTLRLKYEFAGQEVTVGFTEECFKIELADGTEFKIPMGRQKALRRVA